MVGVLHTWGRNLAYHPHIRYLVPGGGIAPDGNTWLATCHPFLLPVKALSLIFRGKLRDALQKTPYYKYIPSKVWQQKWVVHCESVGSGLGALKYLAPYIFRVAISNNRILKLENDLVTFRYRDTDSGADKHCTLGAEDFIHRFLQHVLPKGFVKVRYYGLFSPGKRQILTTLRQRLTEDVDALPVDSLEECSRSKTSATTTQSHVCPVCGHPMQPGPFLYPSGLSPP